MPFTAALVGAKLVLGRPQLDYPTLLQRLQDERVTVTIDARGWIDLQDRSKDLVKSGGEWISSVALENALMNHPAVLEAAVIAIPHPKWLERPLAVVVLREGHAATKAELIAHLAPHFATWWLPDAVEFVSQIPRTPTGKFLKRALRDQFRDYRFPGEIGY